MRKMALVLGFALAACSAGEGKGRRDPCTPTLGGACDDPTLEACDCNAAARVIFCDGSAWRQEADCAPNNQICGADANVAGGFTCVVDPSLRVGEYEPCTGTGAGNCDAGLTCQDLSVFDFVGLSICVADCDPVAANACGPGRSCFDFLREELDVEICTDIVSLRDEPCLLDGTECVGGQGLSCDNLGGASYTGGNSFWCKQRCPYSEIEQGQGSCPGGEECLRATTVDYQFNLTGNVVICTSPGTTTGCDAANGFRCEQVRGGANPLSVCLRDVGWCGTPATILTNLSPVALNALGPADVCSFPGIGTRPPSWPICKGYTAATAEVACTDLPFGFSRAACTDDSTCNYAAGETCVEFCVDDPCTTTAKRCGLILTACVGFCEEPDQTPLTCPATQYCGTPEISVGFPIFQGGATRVACPNGNAQCDQASGFRCITFSDGRLCARDRNVCQACKANAASCATDKECCASTLGVCDIGVSNRCACRGLGVPCTGIANECCAGSCDVGATNTCN